MFQWGFLALGIGIILQLIERVGIGTLANIGTHNFSLTAFLVSIDIALIGVGISCLITAIWGSLTLPLGTNGATKNDMIKELEEHRSTIQSLLDDIQKSPEK